VREAGKVEPNIFPQEVKWDYQASSRSL
jgi:hypothetical protein